MTQFQQYLQVRFEFQNQAADRTGLQTAQRIEVWDYPLDALREAVANALLHRDYTSTQQTMIQVFDHHLTISNPGGLPEGLTVEDLRRPHRSHPRNPLLAQIFYYASLVERWGSGTTRMAQLCRAYNLPEPEFTATPHQFTVTFRKDPFALERLQQLGLTDRQVQVIQYVQAHGSISNIEFRNLTGVSERTSLRDLDALVTANLLTRTTTGRQTRYELRTTQPDKPAINPP